jgi:hypothetical protein
VNFFIHATSQFYQGLEPLNKPMYSMHKWPVQGSEGTTVKQPPIPSSMAPEDVNQQLWGGDTKGCSLLQMFFTLEEVNALKRRIHRETNSKTPRVSSQDAICCQFVSEPC